MYNFQTYIPYNSISVVEQILKNYFFKGVYVATSFNASNL